MRFWGMRKYTTHLPNVRDAAEFQHELNCVQIFHDFILVLSFYLYTLSPDPEIYLLLIYLYPFTICLCPPAHTHQPSKLILRFPIPNTIHLPISPLLTLPHHAHRPPLDHQTHNLKQRICRRHGCMLGISIVRRCDLDDIGCDEIDAFEAADDGAEFAGAPATSFWGACCGGD